jgi:hypothetical protein
MILTALTWLFGIARGTAERNIHTVQHGLQVGQLYIYIYIYIIHGACDGTIKGNIVTKEIISEGVE